MRKWFCRGLMLVLSCLCAGVIVVFWARSYEPPGPRLVEGPVLVKYTSLPRQLLLYYPNQQTCMYASVVDGWIRIARIDIKPPYGPAPTRDDEEAWMWVGRARFPDPTMIGTPLVSKRLHGLFFTGALQLGSMRLRGIAFPCWLVVVILLAPVLFTALKALKTHRLPGTCTKCDYNLAGLTEPRCPECGTQFAPPIIESKPTD